MPDPGVRKSLCAERKRKEKKKKVPSEPLLWPAPESSRRHNAEIFEGYIASEFGAEYFSRAFRTTATETASPFLHGFENFTLVLTGPVPELTSSHAAGLMHCLRWHSMRKNTSPNPQHELCKQHSASLDGRAPGRIGFCRIWVSVNVPIMTLSRASPRPDRPLRV